MSLSRKEILDKVQECLVDALGIDKDEATEDASLTEDLGAESIDFLDIVFRLEKAFNIKVSREELFPGERILNTPGNLLGKEAISAKGLAALKKEMPRANFTKLENNPDPNLVVNLYTVRHLVDYVERELW